VSAPGTPAPSAAERLDAEADYYDHRADEERDSWGSGCYEALLRAMAVDRHHRAETRRLLDGAA
jgi:hypothetical protein